MTNPTIDEAKLRMAKLIVRTWRDEKFRELLETDPKAAFDEMGVPTPADNVTFNVHFASADNYHLVIPAAPKVLTLDDADLIAIARSGEQLVFPSVLAC
ncbi:hypothetical protein [Rhizobium sp. Root482]|uniref:hypothetical protein n=1 Tax=Rhizobium sp. Root482 TaxID=1736543 RepID=UPI000A5E5F4E|nr:hypothetical protein [Rhizobium sp. Root482]